jgi:redox-sensitive bicupin YhaK (pirin superfamily)
MRKSVHSIVRGVPPHWVGDGFPVQSLFSYQDSGLFDPFLLLDYAPPYAFPPARERRGVGEHPHRGFETITIVYQGELAHRDSAGNSGTIGPGDVQWMTAASGVVHEEFHSDRFTREGGDFEVAQLWLNLPAREKMSPPRYQNLTRDRIPVVTLGAPGESPSTVRVIAGSFRGTGGPAHTVTPVTLWDLDLGAGRVESLNLPDGDTTLLLVRTGLAEINESDAVRAGELAVFDRAGDSIMLESQEDSRALLLSGRPLGETVVGQGPFVMNSREEIVQAIRDYQAGKMGRLA